MRITCSCTCTCTYTHSSPPSRCLEWVAFALVKLALKFSKPSEPLLGMSCFCAGEAGAPALTGNAWNGLLLLWWMCTCTCTSKCTCGRFKTVSYIIQGKMWNQKSKEKTLPSLIRLGRVSPWICLLHVFTYGMKESKRYE